MDQWENSGRFSMKFSSERQIIDVIFRVLTKEDEGIYRVGIEEQSGPDSYCEVKLDVKDGKINLMLAIPVIVLTPCPDSYSEVKL